jgi:uncharacterized membrane protein required for colicin V production
VSGGDAPNVLDAVLVLLLALALVRGWRLGAVSQLAAFAGLVLGLLAGLWAAPGLAGLFVTGPGPEAAFLTLGVLLVAMVVGQAVGVMVGVRLHRAVHSAGWAGSTRPQGPA